jgi:RND family efflux transporter MFP subunit
MKPLVFQRRTLALAAVLAPLVVLLAYIALRSGPLAPIAVTAMQVRSQPLRPALFGIGTVDARYTFRISPTFAGRIKFLSVHVGDAVKAGQILGEMDPVDLDDRIRSQEAGLKRSDAALREAAARQRYAATLAKRYESLFARHVISEESVIAKRQELAIADAGLSAAREETKRARSDLEALLAQRANLRLVAPADGIVTLRDADPGTTVVAGQSVLEVIDPDSIWVNVRFDQISASGLSEGLPAHIQLRSRTGEPLPGRVLRIEPKADAVTEEILAKVVFDQLPSPLPSIGELTEVTVDLPALPRSPVIPNAAIQRQGSQVGVWQIEDGKPAFVAVQLGRANLDGQVQVLQRLKDGDRIVVYSEKALTPNSRIHIVERIPGTPR